MHKAELSEPLFPLLTEETYLDASIALISGNIRRGKAILALSLVRKMGLMRKINVFANFQIHARFLPNSNIYYMQEPDDFLSIEDSDTHQVAILDEPNRWGLESRRSQSDLNVDVAGKIQQCGHYNLDVILITQLHSQIDPRGRRLEQIVYYALGLNSMTQEFQYLRIASDYSDAFPFVVPKWYAVKFIYPYYSTKQIINLDKQKEKGEEEDIVLA